MSSSGDFRCARSMDKPPPAPGGRGGRGGGGKGKGRGGGGKGEAKGNNSVIRGSPVPGFLQFGVYICNILRFALKDDTLQLLILIS